MSSSVLGTVHTQGGLCPEGLTIKVDKTHSSERKEVGLSPFYRWDNEAQTVVCPRETENLWQTYELNTDHLTSRQVL